MKCMRIDGEKNGAGVIQVEDENGIEWRVTIGWSKKHPDRLTGYNPVVCWNADYESGGLAYDFMEVAKEFIEAE